MSRVWDYDIWEIDSNRSPPSMFAGAMEPGEQLLWACGVPSARLFQRVLWISAAFLLFSLHLFQIAPWGESVSEYCALEDLRPCGKLYLIAWPGVVVFGYAALLAIRLAFKLKTSPWIITLAITNTRALKIDGRKPTKIESLQLDGKKARRSLFGVKFVKSTSAFNFNELNAEMSDRAVYWVNVERLRSVYQVKATP